jgi:alpha-amylase
MRRLAAAALILVASCASSPRQRAVLPVQNHEWARGAVFYEIFVRSYYDSNGDGIGDFPGLTSKLDYVQSLGADAIWLMPVFQSPSYHGYDATDYETIERDYGSNADFQRFLEEAHKRGIRVILDFVMNHTSNEHPWFTDPSKHNWYVWSPTNPGWTQPWGPNPTWYLLHGEYYYGVFWSGMPDLNYRTPEVKSEMFRISREWLQKGVDGYRLDATRYLIEDGPGAGQYDTPETHQLLKDFTTDVEKAKPDAILVAENTVDTTTLATYYTDGLANFNFPLASAIIDGVNRGDATPITATIRQMLAAYPPDAIDAPFLTNHDQTRIATVLGSNGGKLRDAAAILLTLPGAPFIYYGEELGMQNAPGSEDESKRTPMAWTAAGGFTTGSPWRPYSPGLAQNNVATESGDSQSLLTYYRNWIGARKKSNALLKGNIGLLSAPAQVLAYTRTFNNDRAVVVHNLGNTATTVSVEVSEPIFADAGVSYTATTVTLPPHTSVAFK